MEDQTLYDFGHMFVPTQYADEGNATFVLKQLDRLAAIHTLALEKATKLQKSGHLTAKGRAAQFRELAEETRKQVDDIRKTVSAYDDRIADVERQMTPKPHDPTDIGWRLELREIRDYIRSLESLEAEQFVMSAIEHDDQRVMEAIQFSPVPFTFATQDVMDRIKSARAEMQFPDETAKLQDLRRAQQEVQSALGSVVNALGKQGLDLSEDALSRAEAA